MKRKDLKLDLHRETLQRMDFEQLAEIAGGLTLTCFRTCNSRNTCGTLLC